MLCASNYVTSWTRYDYETVKRSGSARRWGCGDEGPRPDPVNESWAGFVLKLTQRDCGTGSLVPQENRMAPGTLSQGGRRGGWAVSQASTTRAQGERPSECEGTCSVCCRRGRRHRQVRGRTGPA